MMRPPVGLICVASGSSRATVADGPSPGRMPTMVPRNTPRKHQKRFIGARATLKPCARLASISMARALESPGAQRQLHVQQLLEHQPEAGAGAHAYRERRHEPAAENDEDQKQREQKETNDKTGGLEQPDRHHQSDPSREHSRTPVPARTFDGLRIEYRVDVIKRNSSR